MTAALKVNLPACNLCTSLDRVCETKAISSRVKACCLCQERKAKCSLNDGRAPHARRDPHIPQSKSTSAAGGTVKSTKQSHDTSTGSKIKVKRPRPGPASRVRAQRIDSPIGVDRKPTITCPPKPPAEIFEISSVDSEKDNIHDPRPDMDRRIILNELLRVVCALPPNDLNEELVKLMKSALRLREEQSQFSCHEWAQLGITAYTAADKFRLKELWKVATRMLGHPGLNEFRTRLYHCNSVYHI